MMGYDGEPGVIPLAVEEIFDYIEQSEGQQFMLRVSCMEIYNEVSTEAITLNITVFHVSRRAPKPAALLFNLATWARHRPFPSSPSARPPRCVRLLHTDRIADHHRPA